MSLFFSHFFNDWKRRKITSRLDEILVQNSDIRIAKNQIMQDYVVKVSICLLYVERNMTVAGIELSGNEREKDPLIDKQKSKEQLKGLQKDKEEKGIIVNNEEFVLTSGFFNIDVVCLTCSGLETRLKYLKPSRNQLIQSFSSSAPSSQQQLQQQNNNATSQYIRVPFIWTSLIIEEASKQLESILWPSLQLYPLRVIVVGDDKQLSPLVKNEQIKIQTELDRSLFERLLLLGVKPIILNYQGRSIKKICDLYRWRYDEERDKEVKDKKEERIQRYQEIKDTSEISPEVYRYLKEYHSPPSCVIQPVNFVEIKNDKWIKNSITFKLVDDFCQYF
ncbi:MAG: hypothetical protein EZS28_042945 [Streblomastix strix]|uniref:DNA2/NAM7 helicase helicase domain-containing protein n=1 Tax=Streblomastix strix TaxID=222440 RepID=A0A5J4TTI5_9EUKA|nr:MAG: hypothetical protein EZS28_042945 [Streblomastix strix]